MSARLLGHGIVWVGLLLAGLWLAGGWLVVPWVVAGRSMEPALLHGDRVLVDLWTYRHRPPRIGELVLFEGPEREIMVKRLASSPPHSGQGYWLLGDNSSSSRDSRRFGPVPAERIRGRVVLRYWPLTRGSLEATPTTDSYNSTTGRLPSGIARPREETRGDLRLFPYSGPLRSV
jgi:nickel-type superoxide dismutase maturation protease